MFRKIQKYMDHRLHTKLVSFLILNENYSSSSFALNVL